MTIRRPRVTGSLRADKVTAGLAKEKLLFVGQKYLTGTSVSGVLVENILNDNSWDTLFGKGSPIAEAIRRARRVNGETQFDAIALDDNVAGGAATGTLNFHGQVDPLEKTRTMTVYIGSKKFGGYVIPILAGSSATDVGDLVAATINADASALVTAVNVLGLVTVTAKTKGLFGNGIGLRVDGLEPAREALLPGTTLSIEVTKMSGGALDPVLASVFDVIGDNRYQGIVWQFDDLTEVVDLLDSRFNVANDIQDGRAFYSFTDTLANHLTTLTALNTNSLCYNADKLVTKSKHGGPNILEIPFTKAAEFAAIRALRRTDGSILGSTVISRSANDSFGGAHMNSKPYFNTLLSDCLVPDIGDSWTDVEQGQIEDAGGFIMDANSAFNSVITGDVTTTYKTDAAGNADLTWKYLNYVDTATACREYIVANTRAQYPQYRATGGALIPDVDSANEASVASFVIEKIQELGDLALLMRGTGTVNGEQVDYDKLHREGLSVSLDVATGQFSISAKLYIVTQFREALYDFAIAFDV